MRKYIIPFLPFLALALASCSSRNAEAQSDYKLIGTIKDIMDSEVDPSADYIWESISTTVDAAGIVVHEPRTDDEWKEERRRAITLVEAANLIMMPGRRVAKPGDKSENPGIELAPEEIQALIDKDRPAFVQLATKFQQTAIEQLDAVDRRDVAAMLEVGGDLDAACESCHRKYWYPNDPALQPLDPPSADAADAPPVAPAGSRK